jgi:hypothetical protein
MYARDRRATVAAPVLSSGEHLGGEVHAALADEQSGAGDQPADIDVLAPAERADGPGGGVLQRALTRGRVDDLVHALVAEPERVGDLPQRGARRMQTPDRVLIADLRSVGLVLGRDEVLAGPRRLLQQRLVNRIRLPMVDTSACRCAPGRQRRSIDVVPG